VAQHTCEISPRGNITTFKLGHPGFDGGTRRCMIPCCFYQIDVNFLLLLALKEESWNSWRLHVFEIALVAWQSSFILCNKKRLAIRHMNMPLFTTLSIPSYDIGKWVLLRTYQHRLILYSSEVNNSAVVLVSRTETSAPFPVRNRRSFDLSFRKSTVRWMSQNFLKLFKAARLPKKKKSSLLPNRQILLKQVP